MFKLNFENPVGELFNEHRRKGEVIVGQLRLIVLLMFIPLLITRVLNNELPVSYAPIFFIKWGLWFLLSMIVFHASKKGFSSPFVGYGTLFMDISFITISIMVLSAYSNNHLGCLKDPIFTGYLLVCFISTFRFDLPYTIFSIVLSFSAIITLVIFDLLHHQIPVEPIVVLNRIIALLMITILAAIFSKRFQGYILSGHQMNIKHVNEISSIINMDIDGNRELLKIINNMYDKTSELLNPDLIIITCSDNENDQIETCKMTGVTSSKNITDLMIKLTTVSNNEIVHNKTVKVKDKNINRFIKDEKLSSFIAIPLKINDNYRISLTIGKRDQIYFSDYDRLLLSLISEQVISAIRYLKIIETIENDTIVNIIANKNIQFRNIIGRSPLMMQLFKVIERVAKSNIPVLVRGENGTGKELIVDAIHDLSNRKDMPFIKINCAAIPGELLESELFGFEKGAFTGANRQKKGKIELANNGTLFLDEIGDMDITLQIKLLRVLQNKEFDRIGGSEQIKSNFRLITATNQNIEEKINDKKFREDLFFRINGLPIFVPPLRDRPEDIELLVNHFINVYSTDEGKKIELTKSAISYLKKQQWKGNIRELENLIHRIIVMSEKRKINADDIKKINRLSTSEIECTQNYERAEFITNILSHDCDFNSEVEHFEKELLKRAIVLTKGNHTDAIKILNMPRSTFFYKLNKYGMEESNN